MTAATIAAPVQGPAVRVPVLGDLTYSTVPAGLTGSELLAYRKGFDAGVRKYGKAHPRPVVTHDTTGPVQTWAPAPGTPERVAMAQELADRGREYRTGQHPVAHAAGIAELRKLFTARGDIGRANTVTDPATGNPVGMGKPSTRRPSSGRQDLSAFSKALELALRTGDSWAPGKGKGPAVTFSTVPETPQTLAPVTVPEPEQGPWPHAADRATVAEVVALHPRVELIVVEDSGDEPPLCGCGARHWVHTDDETAVLRDVVEAAEIPDPARGRRAARRALAAAMRAADIAPAGDDWARACKLAGIIAP